MKRIKTTLMLLLAGIPLISNKSSGALATETDSGASSDPLDPVVLRPLNEPQDNLFAAHRSHSSHGSHGSHRSSSGGGYVAPRAPAQEQRVQPQQPSAPTGQGFAPQESARPTDPGRAAPVSPKPQSVKPAPLSTTEKRKLQIMRVQISLTSLGLYTGPVDGVLNGQTQEALKRFQMVKGMPTTGLMTTETLNALGVPAAQ